MARIEITPGISVSYDTEEVYSGDYTVARRHIIGTRIEISEEALSELQDDSALLYALIDSGIEDWEGYNKAISLWKERKK